MDSGGKDRAPPPPDKGGGEFLLSLLQQRPGHPQPPLTLQQQQSQLLQQQQQQQSQLLQLQQQQQHGTLVDPAVAAVGPTIPVTARPPFLSPNPTWQQHHHSLSLSPPHLGFPYQNPNYAPKNHQVSLSDDNLPKLGFLSNEIAGGSSSSTTGNNIAIHNLLQRQQQKMMQVEHNVQFGSFSSSVKESELGGNFFNGFDGNHVKLDLKDRTVGGGNYYKSPLDPRVGPRSPPGFLNKPRGGGGGNADNGSGSRQFERNMHNERDHFGEFDHSVNNEKGRFAGLGSKNGDMGLRSGRGGSGLDELKLTEQLDRPGPPAGSNLHSVLGSKVKESVFKELGDDEKGDGELDDIGEELVDSLLLDGEPDGKKDNKQNRHPRDKEYRSDKRGQQILSQRVRMFKAQMHCRRDIDRLDAHFLALYESLIPPEEEKVKQKQLLTLLEKLVNTEWPDAQLYLYGSCGNSFGVLKSDIDVCLAIQNGDIEKSEVLLKLADILQSDNLQNVQPLTRARVPIVKLMDPATGISCDICINNVLAVVNTKLLRDYAQIDERLRQLAFIVKHWAKSRGVNETYQGTLSSYAYVLMCIHFLQQRRPAILPCLQGMKPTYSVTVDDIECTFYDQVENLRGYGSRNNETISQLVWAFFNYWAYRHDYTNDVISIRTGSLISKREKDWTRRIGNDRHLICIEDPFEVSHDLGRVVDKFTIRVLREEFERAAEIMQFDSNPCVTLFERYVPN